MLPFIGRVDEQRVLNGLVAGVREGHSGTLVLAGEAGTGKTTLLDRAVENCEDIRVVRISGVESEKVLGFAALHRLLRPWLSEVDTLPPPQRDALHTAFGRLAGVTADRYLVSMAALTLLAEAATPQPLLCVIDDAHWLDRESAEVLAFVARRLHAESIGLLFAIRPYGTTAVDGLPVLTVPGLPGDDAGTLLAAGTTGHLDGTVATAIVTGTGGNPLALVELAQTLTAEQLTGIAPLPDPLPVGTLLESHFRRQVRSLPEQTQTLLLILSATPPGDQVLLWRAAGHLGVAADRADPALAAGVLTAGLDFRHPLIRSAVYRGADAAARRRVHAALATACDPVLDVDRRAWHRAEATIGLDEQVATELVAAADRASVRGGHAARAAFLSRAADLSPDPRTQAGRLVAAARAHLVLGDPGAAHEMLERAERGLDEPVLRAVARQTRATVEMYSDRFARTPATLLEAARSITGLDDRLARKMMFEALQAVLFTDHRVTAVPLPELSHQVLTSPIGLPENPTYTDLFLYGYANRVAVGYRPAVPLLRAALTALASDDNVEREVLPLAVVSRYAADELWDDEAGRQAWKRLEARDRATGALGTLQTTIMVGAVWELRAGRFAAAEALHDELTELAAVVGHAHRMGVQRIEWLAWTGREEQIRAVAAEPGIGFDDHVQGCVAVLEIALGRYQEALVCLLPWVDRDWPGAAVRSLHEIVEAGVRGGDHRAAKAALARLEERVPVSDTPWGRGLLARCRALMADDSHAEPLYREAIEQLGRTQVATELARAHLLYGEWLRRCRRRGDARVQLRTAYDMFSRMGAEAFAERARVELTATGERPLRRDDPVGPGLTPQERQVAGLAAGGATNSEIAARLFLSTSTVEYHLTKVFRKLGITSRRKLAQSLGG